MWKIIAMGGSMLKRITLFLIVFIALISCTDNKNYQTEIVDGVEIIKNSKSTNDKSQTLDYKYLFTINSFDSNTDSLLFSNIQAMDVDSRKNIYILDSERGRVVKFDKTGKYITSFARNGQGPGELLNPISISVKADTVFVGCKDNLKLVKFDIEGNFAGEIQIQHIPPQFMRSCPGKGFMGFIQEIEQKKGKFFISYNLEFLDNDFNRISTIHKNRIQLTSDLNFLDLLIPFTMGKDNFYVSSNSDNFYEIRKYNRKGELSQRIQKQYKRLSMNKEEVENFDKMITNMNSGHNNGKKINMKAYSKKPVNNLYFDKYGRLITLTSQLRNKKNKDDLLFDIFVDGVFQNSVKADFFKANDYMDLEHQLFFLSDKIYFADMIENEIRVFDY